jgi:hypothetical protein
VSEFATSLEEGFGNTKSSRVFAPLEYTLFGFIYGPAPSDPPSTGYAKVDAGEGCTGKGGKRATEREILHQSAAPKARERKALTVLSCQRYPTSDMSTGQVVSLELKRYSTSDMRLERQVMSH